MCSFHFDAYRVPRIHTHVTQECFNSPYATHHFPTYAEPIPGGETSRLMSALAAECGVFLVGGSIPERENDKVYNTCTVWDPQGRMVAKHRKVWEMVSRVWHVLCVMSLHTALCVTCSGST